MALFWQILPSAIAVFISLAGFFIAFGKMKGSMVSKDDLIQITKIFEEFQSKIEKSLTNLEFELKSSKKTEETLMKIIFGGSGKLNFVDRETCSSDRSECQKRIDLRNIEQKEEMQIIKNNLQDLMKEVSTIHALLSVGKNKNV